jgi:hypothetical protein
VSRLASARSPNLLQHADRPGRLVPAEATKPFEEARRRGVPLLTSIGCGLPLVPCNRRLVVRMIGD